MGVLPEGLINQLFNIFLAYSFQTCMHEESQTYKWLNVSVYYRIIK